VLILNGLYNDLILNGESFVHCVRRQISLMSIRVLTLARSTVYGVNIQAEFHGLQRINTQAVINGYRLDIQ